MNNRKDGVTIIALGMIIIVMGIIVGITGLNINNLLNETQVKEFASELQQLEFLINDYKIRNNGNVIFNEHILNIADATSLFLSQLSEETIVDGIITLYEIDYDKIDAMDTNFGNQENGVNDIYLYSKETGKVYYKLGFEYEGTVYHTLTENLEQKLEN